MFLIEDLQPAWLANSAQRWAYLVALSLVLGLLIGLVFIAYWGAGSYDHLHASNPRMLYLQPWEPTVWLTAMPLWLLAFGWLEGLGSGSGPAVLERVPPRIWQL